MAHTITRMAQTSIRGIRAMAACLLLLPLGPALAQKHSAQPQQRAEVRVAEGLLARQGNGDFAPVRFPPDTAPFALRFNNYAAIKRPDGGGAWPGQTGADGRGYAMFGDPAYGIRAFIDLLRTYHDRYGARSAADIFRRLAPPGDCSGAPTPRAAGGCPENETQPPISAVRAARAVGLGPGDDLQIFGPGGEINETRLRAIIDAAVTQEIGPPYCPQPPRRESWLGCRVDDALYRRALSI
jgi:hypothetical protein